MVTARKKWRIVYPGSTDTDTFASESGAYDFVDALRSSWAAGASTSSLTVQVDKGVGAGWQDSEFINFAEEAS